MTFRPIKRWRAGKLYDTLQAIEVFDARYGVDNELSAMLLPDAERLAEKLSVPADTVKAVRLTIRKELACQPS